MSPSSPPALRVLLGLGRLLLRLLRGSDRAAGGLARVATTIGQVALVSLGVHLAADQLDDQALAGLTALQGWLDTRLAAPLGELAEGLGMAFDALLFWDALPLPTIAAWTALVVELVAVALLCASFLLTKREPRLSWAAWRKAISVHAVVLPLTLAGVLAAGSWSMAMAAEDLLPLHPASRWAAGLLGLAVLLRFGLSAWGRAVAVLERSGKPRRDLLAALFIAPVGLLAWMHGVPLWGLLP
jgi:hypothetical protein